ncbi:MAG: 5'-nucleotidase C-terminal domain-containing protein, partial [Gammaproteobacteria bacterium]|nr:5'-nucleotidase C-terminal domain-containing protein [Gammaproteobacteria bacterium]
ALEETVPPLRQQGADLMILLLNDSVAEMKEIQDRYHPDLLLIASNDGNRVTVGREGMIAVQGGGDEVVIFDLYPNPKTDQVGGHWFGEGRLLQLGRFAAKQEVSTAIDHYRTKLSSHLDQVVGRVSARVDTTREAVRGGENGYGNLVADTLRRELGADVALINGGNLRGDLQRPSGSSLTRGDMLRTLPYKSRGVLVRVSGQQLREAIESGLSRVEEMKGRFPHLSNIRLSYDPNRPPGKRLVTLEVAGAEVVPERNYLLATRDFLAAGGDGYAVLLQGEPLTRVNASRYLWEMVANAFLEAGELEPRIEGRLRQVSAPLPPAEDLHPEGEDSLDNPPSRTAEVRGYSREELLGKNHRLVKSDEHPPELYAEMWQTICNGHTWHGEVKNRNRNGGYYWVRASIVPFLDESGQPFQYISIRTDITHIKEMESALTRANETALKALRAKENFLAAMSHELRTPLTSILGFSEALEETRLGPNQHELLANITISGQALLSLINDILDMSKIEAGNFQIGNSPFELQTLLDGVIALFRIRARDEAVSLRLEIVGDPPPPPLLTVSDPNRLRQVLINLVGNAMKFSKGGSVAVVVNYQTITTTDEGKRITVHFAVRDTGIGISAEGQKRLFRPFAQADSSISGRFGGTGLGLYVSQQLIQLMGSTITVSSVEGEGSCFEFSLEMPLLPGEAAPSGEKRATIPALEGEVLIADDTSEIRRLLESFVRATGARCTLVENGEEAVERALGGDFDLVLMDMQMPVMNGIDATAMLRQLGITIPIYALTANVMQSHRDQFSEAGCSGFLAKPIERSELYQRLAQHLAPGKEGGEHSAADDAVDDDLRQQYLSSLQQQLAEAESALEERRWAQFSEVIHKV